jgi:hypothetical protein
MNSASRGLRPTVGLRRPKRHPSRRRRPTPGAQRPERPISIGVKASGQRSACADRKGILRVGEGQRPARSARRGRFPIGVKASGQRSACADRGASLASAEADARRAAPGEADFNRRESLRPTVGLRRPKRHPSRRRRPTPGAQRPERPISIGVKASGQRSACADRKGILCVGGGRRPARSARRGRFQSAQRAQRGPRRYRRKRPPIRRASRRLAARNIRERKRAPLSPAPSSAPATTSRG